MLTEQQLKAVDEVAEWFRTWKLRKKQVFRVFGYAGTGKSTLVSHAIQKIGLPSYDEVPSGGVAYGAFTAKAAKVLSEKGCPAATLHSLMYTVKEVTESERDRIREQIKIIENELEKDNLSQDLRKYWQGRLYTFKNILTEAFGPKFRVNVESPLSEIALLVVDEVSMIDERMGNDILSFNKPVLVLGDPGQLPPIKGEGFFLNDEPDVMLTEIHRQAADSPILTLATMARKGESIPFGKFGEKVVKVPLNKVRPMDMKRADQVICGRNITRFNYNHLIRQSIGYEDTYPMSGEKVICLRNNAEMGLVNGGFIKIENARHLNDISFSAEIILETGENIGEEPVYSRHFHGLVEKEAMAADWKYMKNMVVADYGHVITCHKAQGSSFGNVIVIDDKVSRNQQDARKWLYTAITRAEKGLVICE